MRDLMAANVEAHARFIGALEDALVAFTALEGEAAMRHWLALARHLAAHQLIEEELLACLALHTDAPSPRGGASDLVVAEHRRLDHLHALAAQRIAEVQATPPEARRLAMVRGLDDVLRVRHLLEHHAQREDRIVYPHLVATLPPALCAAFAERLAAV